MICEFVQLLAILIHLWGWHYRECVSTVDHTLAKVISLQLSNVHFNKTSWIEIWGDTYFITYDIHMIVWWFLNPSHCQQFWFTLGDGTTENVFMILSGYSSRILLMSRVPIPEPVPPPREWVSWKPCRQSQPSASLRTTSSTESTSSAPSV